MNYNTEKKEIVFEHVSLPWRLIQALQVGERAFDA